MNRDHPMIEARAEMLYNALEYDGAGHKPAWVKGGNSQIQDECRRIATLCLKGEGVDLFAAYWPFTKRIDDRLVIARLVNSSVLAFQISPRAGYPFEDFRPEFEGTIRFDRCINWSTSANYNAHICELDEFDNIRAAFAAAQEIAAHHLEGWIA